MLKSCLTFSLLLICLGGISCVLNPKVVCYYDNWFVWRSGDGQMTTKHIDSSLCTHIVYGYLGVTTDSDVYLNDPDLMITRRDLKNFTDIKGNAKALATIGGYSFSQEPSNFTYMVSNPNKFVDNVMAFMNKFGFDGITIDWSHDNWGEDDMTGFVKVLEALYSKFSGRYTLGISLNADALHFDIKSVNDIVDFMTIQTIDYSGKWMDTVDYAASLRRQMRSMNDWVKQGGVMNKLLMTVPFYAHTWILADPHKSEPKSKATGPGKPGRWSQAEGKLSYNEICTDMMKDPKQWDLHRDRSIASIYAVHDGTWISYEDEVSCEQKANAATTEGFGGIVVQALENDDFRGLCQGKYPLLKAINKGLNKDPTPERTTTEAHPRTPDPKDFCQKAGEFRDHDDCNVYHNCIEYFPGVFTDEVHHCPDGLAFDEVDHLCKDPQEVEGCH